jgi:hypothetical protein
MLTVLRLECNGIDEIITFDKRHWTLGESQQREPQNKKLYPFYTIEGFMGF